MAFIKHLFNPLFSLLARACEKSDTAARIISKVHFRGKGCIVERIRSDAMPREVVATCGKVKYRLDLRDDVQREIYFNVFERQELRQALELIPKGGACIDVGANNGAFALPFARKVGSQGVVHAFEPDSDVFARLRTNVRLNSFERFLKCHQVAVSNISTSRVFHRSSIGHSGWGSLQEFKDIARRTETVQAVTLDDFLARERLGEIDFLKVDVEAHEPELLEGAQESLRNQVFRYILIEFNGVRLAERGKTLEDFLDPILRNGYRAIDFGDRRLQRLRAGVMAPSTVCTSFFFTARS